jgi:hypothetical protein
MLKQDSRLVTKKIISSKDAGGNKENQGKAKGFRPRIAIYLGKKHTEILRTLEKMG